MSFDNGLASIAIKDCNVASASYEKLFGCAHVQGWLVAFALTFGLGIAGYVTSAAATVLEGEALYRERIMPPTPASGSRAKPDMPSSCAQAETQAALNDCAYSEFLDISAEPVARLDGTESKLLPAQRSHWRKV